MARPRVFVTGAGLITATGNGYSENLEAFRKKQSGIGKITHLSTIHNDIPAAEVKHSHAELMSLAGVDPGKGIYSRNALLALTAARQLAAACGRRREWQKETGLVMATTTGGMDLNERLYPSLLLSPSLRDNIPAFDSADCTEKVADRLGIRQNVTTVSTACSSSANAIMIAARLIRDRRLKRVVAGGSDSLTAFTLNGFMALEIISPAGCRPFTAGRDGLTIGEGAALLLLESEEAADTGSILCEVRGYANVNEAYHATASSPEGRGARMAMQQALEEGELSPGEIDYINAHGTGTEINDLAEGRAIEQVFGRRVPAVSSTKAFTGHTLGAAGAVEAVYSVMALREQSVLPGGDRGLPMPELSFACATEMQCQPLRHVMSNSFGFGGNNTTLIFSKT